MSIVVVPTMPEPGEIVRLGDATYGRVVVRSVWQEDGVYEVRLRVEPIDETDVSRIAWLKPYKSTPAQLASSRSRYYGTDPRKRFAYRANRKVAKYGRPDDLLDWRDLPDGPWSCHACGVPCESWDHIEPLSMGGSNQPENLLPSCLPCNQSRTAQPLRQLVPLLTSCRRGHPHTPENTRLDGKGIRRCRACARIYAHDAWVRRRSA